MENMNIRLEARKQAVPLRLLAAELGISEPTLYRRLARKMTRADRERYLTAIRTVSQRQNATHTV